MRWRPVKIKNLDKYLLDIETETGHIVKFKLNPTISVDIDNDEDGQPFFFLSTSTEYLGVKPTKEHMSLEKIKETYEDKNILSPAVVYDHIQIGFVYGDATDPENHKWMINFMDVNNKYLFGYTGTTVRMACPFSTMSWEEGIWHGRFVVSKKDLDELLEPEQGQYILRGKNKIEQDITSNIITEDYDKISLTYNIYENMWYCSPIKKDKILGKIPCKNIISDAPLTGKVDFDHKKPKVSAEINKDKIQGISMALNALIIKVKP